MFYSKLTYDMIIWSDMFLMMGEPVIRVNETEQQTSYDENKYVIVVTCIKFNKY